jgi:putative membrane protein
MHSDFPSVTPRRAVAWAAFAAFLLAIAAFTGEPGIAAQGIAVGGILLSFAVAIAIHGWRGALLLIGACLLITFSVENLGVATGFPFGRYHFEVGGALPRIGAIPLIVGPLYFGVGYLAWVIAGILLDDADLDLGRPFNVIALPIVASFVLVQWDLVMDPPNSTLQRAWIWHQGGGYFGVPLSNYIGWYGTVWLFFQAFALMMHIRPSLFARPGGRPGAEIRLAPILLYLAIGLSQLVPYFNVGADSITDPAGETWRARDLRETSVIVMAFSMAPTAILALLLHLKRSGVERWLARCGRPQRLDLAGNRVPAAPHR